MLEIASSVWKYVSGNLWRAVAIAALIFAGVQTVRVHFKGVQITAERNAHAKTKITYREAEVKAQELELKRLESVKKQQEIVNEESADRYNDRITALNSRVAELLRRRDSNRSNAQGVQLSEISDSSSRADEGSREDGFPAFELEDRVTATEQAIQLEELQLWVKKQVAIDPNKESTNE